MAQIDAGEQEKFGLIAAAIYQAWWDGDGHVCSTFGCPKCLQNARIAAEVFYNRVDPWTLEVKPAGSEMKP